MSFSFKFGIGNSAAKKEPQRKPSTNSITLQNPQAKQLSSILPPSWGSGRPSSSADLPSEPAQDAVYSYPTRVESYSNASQPAATNTVHSDGLAETMPKEPSPNREKSRGGATRPPSGDTDRKGTEGRTIQVETEDRRKAAQAGGDPEGWEDMELLRRDKAPETVRVADTAFSEPSNTPNTTGDTKGVSETNPIPTNASKTPGASAEKTVTLSPDRALNGPLAAPALSVDIGSRNLGSGEGAPPALPVPSKGVDRGLQASANSGGPSASYPAKSSAPPHTTDKKPPLHEQRHPVAGPFPECLKPEEAEAPWRQKSGPTSAAEGPLNARPITSEEIAQGDVVIVAIGPTGAGKSTFISIATGLTDGKNVVIGHSLSPCTNKINAYKTSYPNLLTDRNIVLVDTPGIQNKETLDEPMLQSLLESLKRVRKIGAQLGGVLYFHRINYNRMSEKPSDALKTLRRICGNSGLDKVTLVTTMWDMEEESEALSRFAILGTEPECFGLMVALGSQLKRFDRDFRSAIDVLSCVTDPIKDVDGPAKGALRSPSMGSSKGTQPKDEETDANEVVIVNTPSDTGLRAMPGPFTLQKDPLPTQGRMGERLKGQRIKDDEIDADDVIIAVIGTTGAGKSTFVSIASGLDDRETVQVGHSLTSCTREIATYRISCPLLVDKDIVLVDTPGFDDTNISDADTLKRLSKWLEARYKGHTKLAGILYFHRISDNRMAGTPLKNLRMFQKLCGEDSLKKVTLVTTMWDMVESEEVGLARLNELTGDIRFWKAMIDNGSEIKKFHCDFKSVLDVLSRTTVPIKEAHDNALAEELEAGRNLSATAAPQSRTPSAVMSRRIDTLAGGIRIFSLGHKPSTSVDTTTAGTTLRLQQELVDEGKDLRATEAGQVLFSKLQVLVDKRQAVLDRFKAEIELAGEEGIPSSVLTALAKELEDAQKEIDAARKEVVSLKLSIGEHLSAWFKAWRSLGSLRRLLMKFKRYQFTQEDVVILAIGPLGTGKSKFVSIATCSEDVAIGNSLKPCTNEINIYRKSYPNLLTNRNIVLVDTPGFANETSEDGPVLKSLFELMKSVRKIGAQLGGILYFHRITDNRILGSTLDTLLYLQMLCGESGLDKVILVTTMWNREVESEASTRFATLGTDPECFGIMVALGSQLKRLDSNYKSVEEVLRCVTDPIAELDGPANGVPKSSSGVRSLRSRELKRILDKAVEAGFEMRRVNANERRSEADILREVLQQVQQETATLLGGMHD